MNGSKSWSFRREVWPISGARSLREIEVKPDINFMVSSILSVTFYNISFLISGYVCPAMGGFSGKIMFIYISDEIF